MTDNTAHHHISSFFLVGIPGLESVHCWIGTPVCLLFVLTLLGNSIIIATVKLELSLHQPMLGGFWFDAHWIDFDSALLVTMAFDHYVAICIPLLYTTILTTTMVIKIGVVGLSRAVLLIMPCPILIKKLLYYTKYVIHHAYCEHMAASANTHVNRAYGILVALSVTILDLGLIATSYIKIIQAVFWLSSKNAGSKTLGTCVSHICTILAFYTPALFSFLTHCFGKNVPSSVHIIFAIPYLLVSPTVNPMVYGIKTKQIRD
uniref:Olfactory receptor 629 n=1 Tax=Nannospalax galili TaxID=1026970 RepID=A0A8C6RK42_NANGA